MLSKEQAKQLAKAKKELCKLSSTVSTNYLDPDNCNEEVYLKLKKVIYFIEDIDKVFCELKEKANV